mgnify:FL=1
MLAVVWHNGALTGEWDVQGPLGKGLNLAANMGWLGVQLFFVLSGFLITGILVDGAASPHRLRNFVVRRALRIFPLYYATLALAFVLLPGLGFAPEWAIPSKPHAVFYWTYTLNWVPPVPGGGGGLSHLWSLAVEEQFYLVWPLAMWGLGDRSRIWLCAILIASAPLARAVLASMDPAIGQWPGYELTVARWDALAVGALVALAARRDPWSALLRRMAPTVLLGSLAVLAAIVTVRHGFPAVGPGLTILHQSLAAVIFGALVAWAALPGLRGSSPRSLLAGPFLRGVGKYSYGIYVVHLPVIVTLREPWLAVAGDFQRAHPTAGVVARVLLASCVSATLAVALWHWLEAPAMRWKRYFEDRR